VTGATDILMAQRQAERNAGRAALRSLQPAEAPPAAAPGGTLSWAKAAAGWRNAAGNDSYVDAYPCDDRSGANARSSGNTIRIYLPRPPGQDPNVLLNQVVGYIADAAGANIAAVGYLDDAIGTVKLWSKTGTLPAGWVDCAPNTGASPPVQALAGSFPVGLKSGDSDFGTLGNSGNQDRKTHAHNLERDVYTPPPPANSVYVTEGQYETARLNMELCNHLPPWCVVRFIERIDNSGQ
jgi:hypothetical protein